MNELKPPSAKSPARFFLFAVLALLFFAVLGAVFSWKAVFTDPKSRVESSTVILVAVPGVDGKSPHGVVSTILKGRKDPRLHLSIGSPILGLYERYLQEPQQPEAVVVFMAPRFGVTGPLVIQAVAPVVAGAVEGTQESLEKFSGKFPEH